jgi:HEAT repeat protein
VSFVKQHIEKRQVPFRHLLAEFPAFLSVGALLRPAFTGLAQPATFPCVVESLLKGHSIPAKPACDLPQYRKNTTPERIEREIENDKDESIRFGFLLLEFLGLQTLTPGICNCIVEYIRINPALRRQPGEPYPDDIFKFTCIRNAESYRNLSTSVIEVFCKKTSYVTVWSRFFKLIRLFLENGQFDPSTIDWGLSERAYFGYGWIMLNETDSKCKIEGAAVFARFGIDASYPNIINRLCELINTDDNPEVLCASIEALGLIGHKFSNELIPYLFELMDDDYNNLVNISCIEALQNLLPPEQHGPLIKRLVDIIISKSSAPFVVLNHARSVLSQFDAVLLDSPELFRIARHVLTENDCHGFAEDCMKRLGTAAARKDVLQLYDRFAKSASIEGAERLARAVQTMGEKAATPNILSALAKVVRHIRGDSLWGPSHNALRNFGSAAVCPDVLSVLEDMLSDEDIHTHSLAAHTLAFLGPTAITSSIREKLTLLANPDQYGGEWAAWALWNSTCVEEQPQWENCIVKHYYECRSSSDADKILAIMFKQGHRFFQEAVKRYFRLFYIIRVEVSGANRKIFVLRSVDELSAL